MLNHIIDEMKKVIASGYMKQVQEAFSTFSLEMKGALDNPNSYLNYFDYKKKLDAFHWAWPYGIQAKELKILLEQAKCEADFDKLMVSFFTQSRMEEMFRYIEETIPRKHRTLIKQIHWAYKNKHYALINNAVMSVIDNLFIDLLKNPSCVTRNGILHPVIKYYGDNYALKDIGFVFELMMLSNSVDLIFSYYSFSCKVNIQTNKKARRHPTVHGVMYSNKKADSIMLLNTLAAILNNRKYLLPFNNTLEINKNKQFAIGCRSYVVRNRIKKQLGII